jgi:hypothetical protein
MTVKWNKGRQVEVIHRALRNTYPRDYKAKPALLGQPRFQIIHNTETNEIVWEGPNFKALTPNERAEATLQLLSLPGGEELLHKLENPQAKTR